MRLASGEIGLRLRGLRWKPRREQDIRREELLRLDIAQTVAKSLSVIDTLQGIESTRLRDVA